MARPKGSKNKEVASKGLPIRETKKVKVSVREVKAAEKAAEKKAKESEERRIRIQELLTPTKNKDVVDVHWDVKDSEFVCERWIVVLTPEGNLYQEPVPRYASYENFLKIICNIPDANGGVSVRDSALEAIDLGTPKSPFILITAETINGSKQDNKYIRCFRKGFKPTMGCLVFSKDMETPFTKKEAEKAVDWIIRLLEKEEDIEVED